jgi:hypothetical protein
MSSRWSVLQAAAEAAERVPEARMSRRRALRRGALATAGLAGVSLLDAAPALAWWGSQPRPIPGGFDATFTPVPSNPLFHVLPPTIGFEMATITDFHGVLAAAEMQGRAVGSDGSSYTYDADMRFMHGKYVGLDGRTREGTFGFI